MGKLKLSELVGTRRNSSELVGNSSEYGRCSAAYAKCCLRLGMVPFRPGMFDMFRRVLQNHDVSRQPAISTIVRGILPHVEIICFEMHTCLHVWANSAPQLETRVFRKTIIKNRQITTPVLWSCSRFPPLKEFQTHVFLMAANAADILDGAASGDPQLSGSQSENDSGSDVIMVSNLEDEPGSSSEPLAELLDQSLVCFDDAAATCDCSADRSDVESSQTQLLLCEDNTSGSSSYDETGMDDDNTDTSSADHEVTNGLLMLRSVDGTWTSFRFIASGGDSGCDDDPGSESVGTGTATDTDSPANNPADYHIITNGMLMLRGTDGMWTSFRFVGRTP